MYGPLNVANLADNESQTSFREIFAVREETIRIVLYKVDFVGVRCNKAYILFAYYLYYPWLFLYAGYWGYYIRCIGQKSINLI